MSQRGKPFAKGNTFGKGRPPGSLNQTSLLLQQLLLENGEEIMEKAIELAKKGHPVGRKLCVERLVPRLKDLAGLPVETPLEAADLFKVEFFDKDGNLHPDYRSARPNSPDAPLQPPESAPRRPVQSVDTRPLRSVPSQIVAKRDVPKKHPKDRNLAPKQRAERPR